MWTLFVFLLAAVLVLMLHVLFSDIAGVIKTPSLSLDESRCRPRCSLYTSLTF